MGDYYAIQPMLPELVKSEEGSQALPKEYSSGDTILGIEDTRKLMEKHNLMIGQEIIEEGEFLR